MSLAPHDHTPQGSRYTVSSAIPALELPATVIPARIKSFHISQRIAGDLVALIDIAAIGLTALFTVWLAGVNGVASPAEGRQVLLLAPAIALIGALAFRSAGLHTMRMLLFVARQSLRLLGVWSLVAVVSSAALFAFYSGPPVVLIAWLCLAPAALICLRTIISLVLRKLLDTGVLARRVALVGGLPGLAPAAHLINNDRLTTLSAVFELPESDEDSRARFSEIMQELIAGDFDDLVVLVPSTDNHGLESVIDGLCMLPARVSLLPLVALQTIEAIEPGKTEAVTVVVAEKPVRGWSVILKSVFDYTTALVMLTCFAVPMAAIAIAIKLEGPGPIIFLQHRTGLGGRVFRIWKFRSMRVQEDGDDIRQAEKHDARVTAVGRVIRRLSLDELPQIFNVLRGEMSIVGPRPHARAHDTQYGRQILTYTQRFRVKPGITGWAQIHGFRGETKTLDEMARRIDHDIDYAGGYSFWRDVYIVAMTPFFGILRPRAY